MKGKPALFELVVGSGGPGKSGEEEAGSDYEVSPEQVDAAKEVLRAVRKGDPKALARAICMMHDLHEPDGDEFSEEESYKEE